ncbi:MAG: SDR family oxidoreductase [Bacilli bacterium]|nr:SDR family oxidoreductase [Bacilli bacterium]
MKRIALIVGSSGSLGSELIKKYLDNDYTVYALYNSHKISIYNKKLMPLKYDLTVEKKFLELKKELKGHVNSDSQVSIIYAPGIYYKVDIENYNEEELFNNIKINVTGFLNIYKSIFEYLKESKITNIVLIGSNLLERKNIGSLYYVLSKGMQTQLVKQLAYEHGKYNILFNQISPGMFISNMNSNMDNEKIEKIENNIPIKRIGTANEIANFIYEFTSTNTLITGEEIVMDGGNTIGY